MHVTKLSRAHGDSVADQCRSMGLAVGDTIIGREDYKVGWGEVRLTVLWIGKTEVAFDEEERSSGNPDWGPKVESTRWTLVYREWRKISADVVDAA